jgi:diguanylate cyclase (GGDEF)-like protein
LADLLRQQLRRGDALARMGGEEFVLLWPRTDAEAALAAGERLRAAVATHDWAALDPALQVRVSVGLALRLAGEDLEPAIARADAALYRAKAAGRNRVSAPTVWGELPPA